MANPELLVCDADALVQVFIANQFPLLRCLRDNYGIQPVVVEEVDVELRWMRRYKDRFKYALERALKSGALSPLDRLQFQAKASKAPLGASWETFQKLGQQYEGRVHRGEAYTFAAAVILGMPALSNDFSAIKTLQANLLSLPSPVLRSFDLLAFGFHSGLLQIGDCERARSELLKNNEIIPRPFANASFEKGLSNFSCRLVEGSPSVAASVGDYYDPLYIAKT